MGRGWLGTRAIPFVFVPALAAGATVFGLVARLIGNGASQMFTDFDIDLPQITIAAIQVTTRSLPIVVGAIWGVAIATIGVSALWHAGMKRVGGRRSGAWAPAMWLAERWPLVGCLFRNERVASFYRVLAALARQGFPTDAADEITSEIVGRPVVSPAIHDAVRAGYRSAVWRCGEGSLGGIQEVLAALYAERAASAGRWRAFWLLIGADIAVALVAGVGFIALFAPLVKLMQEIG